MQRVAPGGMAAMLPALMALAALYPSAYRGGAAVAQGLRFGLRLALRQALAYFIQLLGAGVAIALIYRPSKA